MCPRTKTETMADVEQLLSEYIAEHRAGGEADPRPYLDQVSGTDRVELATLIDAYLVRAPGRTWDPQAFAQSKARDVADAVSLSIGGVSGAWPWLLPQLRKRAELPRRELVRRLAEALEVADREGKVESYYHRMETGDLPAEGVSDRVLVALSAIVGESVDALRRAGEIFEPTVSDEAADMVFARTATPGADYEHTPTGASPGPEASARPEPDEVDELFTGG
jgi:hypothetical protein